MLVLSHKFYGGIMPSVNTDLTFKSGWEPDKTGQYNEELAILHRKLEEMGAEIEHFNFREALRIVMEISSAGNALLQFNEPWKTHKDEPETVAAVLNLCIQYLAAMSYAMHPFMPGASARLRNLLALDPLTEQGSWMTTLDALAAGEKLIPEGNKLNQPEHLFSRIEDEWVAKQFAKLHEMSAAVTPQTTTAAPAPLTAKEVEAKAPMSYDDFAKMDIRTARILAAERCRHPRESGDPVTYWTRHGFPLPRE